MGKLISMPIRKPAAVLESTLQAEPGVSGSFQVWLTAPREGTASFAGVYINISCAMQAALRRWTGEWLANNPTALERRVTAFPLLAFSCTRPYRGRSSNLFTYDVLQTAAVDRALKIASRTIADRAHKLEVARKQQSDAVGVRVLPDKVAPFVERKRHNLYRMFHVETQLMDELLKFAQVSIGKVGLEQALVELRSAFARHLHRFSSEFDMAAKTDALIQIATDALRGKESAEVELPLAA